MARLLKLKFETQLDKKDIELLRQLITKEQRDV